MNEMISSISNPKALCILNRAKHGGKYDYSVYNYFKRELESLGLSSMEYQRAIISLARILRV